MATLSCCRPSRPAPPTACNYVNNVIIGTHATITADNLRPSAQVNNFKQNDWGMIFSLAAGSTLMLNDTMAGYLVAAQAAALRAQKKGQKSADWSDPEDGDGD